MYRCVNIHEWGTDKAICTHPVGIGRSNAIEYHSEQILASLVIQAYLNLYIRYNQMSGVKNDKVKNMKGIHE